MRKIVLAVVAVLWLSACTMTLGPGSDHKWSYTPNAEVANTWFDGTGPRGASGGGP